MRNILRKRLLNKKHTKKMYCGLLVALLVLSVDEIKDMYHGNMVFNYFDLESGVACEYRGVIGDPGSWGCKKDDTFGESLYSVGLDKKVWNYRLTDGGDLSVVRHAISSGLNYRIKSESMGLDESFLIMVDY